MEKVTQTLYSVERSHGATRVTKLESRPIPPHLARDLALWGTETRRKPATPESRPKLQVVNGGTTGMIGTYIGMYLLLNFKSHQSRNASLHGNYGHDIQGIPTRFKVYWCQTSNFQLEVTAE